MLPSPVQQSPLMAIALAAMVLWPTAALAQTCDGGSAGTRTLTCNDCSAVDPSALPHGSFSGDVQLTTSCQADAWRTKSDYPLQHLTGSGTSAGCDFDTGPARCQATVASFGLHGVSGTLRGRLCRLDRVYERRQNIFRQWLRMLGAAPLCDGWILIM